MEYLVHRFAADVEPHTCWETAWDFRGKVGVQAHTLEYCVAWYREWLGDGKIFRMMRMIPPVYRIRNIKTNEVIPCDIL